MKKVTAFILFMICFGAYSQDDTSKKILIGISYSLTNNDSYIFSNPFSGYVNYQVKKWDNLDLNVGIRAFYFSSNEKETFSNRLGFNPNVSSAYHFKNSKLLSYLAVGYYFDSFEFKPISNGIMGTPNRDVKSNGVTIAPGLKYFIQENIFLDTNLTLLFSTTKDASFYTESSNTFLNIGIGVAF